VKFISHQLAVSTPDHHTK